jgi:hypothetical protein
VYRRKKSSKVTENVKIFLKTFHLSKYISNMTESEIISRIIELETPIVERIINDNKFKATDGDEYQASRLELIELREKVKHIIYPPSYLPSGFNPQRP